MVSTFGHVDDSSFYDDAEPSWNPEYAAAFAAPERYGGYSFADDDDLDHAGIAGITDRNAVYDALPSVVRDYCSTSVFNRAQIIVAQADTKASALICRQDPEDGSVFLSGRIRGTTSPHSIYDVWLDYHAPIRRLSHFVAMRMMPASILWLLPCFLRAIPHDSRALATTSVRHPAIC